MDIHRRDQLRLAKRRQRARERKEGSLLYQLRLPAQLQEKLKVGMQDDEFTKRLHAFLDHEVIRVDLFPNLKLVCWNLSCNYITRKEAFDLYERNWRHVDEGIMTDAERQLIEELKVECGNGVLNV